MPSVGSIDVTAWAGRMPWPQLGIGIIPGAVGVDGDGVIIGALKSSTVTIQTGVTIAGDQKAGNQLADRYRAFTRVPPGSPVGTLPAPITVVDSLGNTWALVRVLSCIAAVTVLAVTNQVRVDCVWIFKVPVQYPS